MLSSLRGISRMPAQGACFSAYALPRAAPKFAPGVYAKWGANRLRRLLEPRSFKVQQHGAKGSRCRRNRCPPQGGGAKLGGGGRKMLSSMFGFFFLPRQLSLAPCLFFVGIAPLGCESCSFGRT